MKCRNPLPRLRLRSVAQAETGRRWMPAIDPGIESDDSRMWRRIEECPFDWSTSNPWLRRIRLN